MCVCVPVCACVSVCLRATCMCSRTLWLSRAVYNKKVFREVAKRYSDFFAFHQQWRQKYVIVFSASATVAVPGGMPCLQRSVAYSIVCCLMCTIVTSSTNMRTVSSDYPPSGTNTAAHCRFVVVRSKCKWCVRDSDLACSRDCTYQVLEQFLREGGRGEAGRASQLHPVDHECPSASPGAVRVRVFQ